MIRQCSCADLWMDEQYGAHMRVQNRTKEGYRCTVCLKETKTTPLVIGGKKSKVKE